MKKDDFIDEQKHIKGHSVFLNVYYKSRVSVLLQYIGLGIFHTAVEINDNEYSFGYTNEGYCGIVVNTPGQSEWTNVKEKIYIGKTLYSQENINELIMNISDTFKGDTYNCFNKNCNDFAKYFSSILLLEDFYFPKYINESAKNLCVLSVFSEIFNFEFNPNEIKIESNQIEDRNNIGNSNINNNGSTKTLNQIV